MTISTNDTRDEYTATTGQTVFNYTFKIFADTDLLVYQTLAGNTPDSSTDLITAYTVSGAGNDAGGSITLTTPAGVGDLITIVSNIPESRTVDYQTNGDYVADTVNDDFDRNISINKQLSAKVDRLPQFDNALQSLTGLTMASPSAGGFLRWKSDLSGIENVVLNTSESATNAAAVSISDSGSYYTGTDVEAALQEIGADIATLEAETAINWTRFDEVGSGTTISGIDNPAICAMHSTRIAYFDRTIGELRAYDLASDNTWSLAGSGLSISTPGDPALCRINDSRVAFIDDTNAELRMYTFNGSAWSLVGSALSVSGVSNPTLDRLSSNSVVLGDAGNDEITKFTWNGSTWEQTGNSFSYVAQVTTIAVCSLTEDRIVTIGSSSNTLIEYNFDGSDWVQATGSLTITCGSYPRLIGLGGTYFAFFDNNGAQTLSIWRKQTSTSQFTQISDAYALPTPAEGDGTAINGTDIVYINESDEKLRLYRASYAPAVPNPLS